MAKVVKRMEKTRKPSVVSRVLATKLGGRELWRVSASDGRIKTLATSKRTAQVMDKAMTKYARALRRLADR
jgi:hypothetical protein